MTSLRYLAVLLLANIAAMRILIQNVNYTLPQEILDNFHDYDTIYHYNNKTMNFFGIQMGRGASFLINHDDDKRIIKRPDGSRYFHLIFLENVTQFTNYTLIPNNLNYFDVVLMVIYGNATKNDLHSLKTTGLTLFYNITNRKLYETCCFCNNKLKSITYRINLTNYQNTYRDFNGHQFIVTFGNYNPFFWHENNETKGLEAKLLQTLSKKLNFTYKLVRFTAQGNESEWGAMIRAVENKTVDFAISGISASEKRFKTTDFTRYFMTDSFRVLFSIQQDPWSKVRKTMFLVQWPVVLCIIVTILIVILISVISSNLERKHKRSPYYFFNASISLLVDQPSQRLNYISSGHYNIRMLYVLWWLLIVCITTYYKSKWASLLATPQINFPDNIEQLVDGNYKFLARKTEWSLLYEYLLTSTNPTYKEILNNIDVGAGRCEGIKSIMDEKTAILDEETALEFKVYNYCKNRLSPIEMGKLRFLNDRLFPGGFHGWSLQKASPLQRQFSSTMAWLENAGIIDYWFRLETKKGDYFVESTHFAPLGIDHILALFVIYTVGISFSLIAFAVEFFYRK